MEILKIDRCKVKCICLKTNMNLKVQRNVFELSSSFGSSRGNFTDLRIGNYTFQIITRNITF